MPASGTVIPPRQAGILPGAPIPLAIPVAAISGSASSPGPTGCWAAAPPTPALILAGEWWRSLAATSLHADNEHFLGNLVSGFFILNLLNHRLGMGTILALPPRAP